MKEIEAEAPRASDFTSRRFGLYILGAGFSKPGGLPLACELWPEVMRRAKHQTGRARESFEDDFRLYLDFRLECDGVRLTPDTVNFEEFMAFLDIEHYLGLRGKDTWSFQGNETQVLVKTLIGEILTESTPSNGNIPDLYLRFASVLKPPDLLLTFNYDILLERALEAAGVPYRLFPDRLKQEPDVQRLSIDNSREEVVVLKLHGSVDWFDRTSFNELEELRVNRGFSTGTQDMVFSNMEEMGAVPLIDGVSSPDDPLRNTYRVREIDRLYRNHPLFHVTPSLLNPSYAKIVYSQMLRNFWWGLGDGGILNFGMAIIGFSLPQQDEYARQVIYRLVKNYQGEYWGKSVLDHQKAPLLLIDSRRTKEEEREFRERYAFVDWNKAKTHLGGFDDAALDILETLTQTS